MKAFLLPLLAAFGLLGVFFRNPDLDAKNHRIAILFQEPVQEQCLPDIGPVEETGLHCDCNLDVLFMGHGNCAAKTPCTFRFQVTVNAGTCAQGVKGFSFLKQDFTITKQDRTSQKVFTTTIHYKTPGCGTASRPVVKFKDANGEVVGGCKFDLDCNDCKAVIGQG